MGVFDLDRPDEDPPALLTIADLNSEPHPHHQPREGPSLWP